MFLTQALAAIPHQGANVVMFLGDRGESPIVLMLMMKYRDWPGVRVEYKETTDLRVTPGRSKAPTKKDFGVVEQWFTGFEDRDRDLRVLCKASRNC